MTDRSSRHGESHPTFAAVTAIGLIVGGGLGAIAFVLWGSPIWLAIAAGLGLALGAIVGMRLSGDDR